MEMEEMRILSSRASQLNAKINDAIERAVIVDINLNKERFEQGTSSSSGKGHEAGVEARNLISIRDALEVLEDQLEGLQALQQQQKAEKEAALADLEESRRDLLGKLRDYQGREWEVVHEALVFTGETMDENHGLPLPPYPKFPSTDTSAAVSHGQSAIYYKSTDCSRENAALKQLPWKEEKYELFISEVDEGSDSQTGEEMISNKDVQKGHKVPKKILVIICNSISRFIGSPTGKVVTVAAKAGFAAAGLVALLNFTEAGMKRRRKQGIPEDHSPPEKSISSPVTDKNQGTVQEKCPTGKTINFEDDMQECVRKEHGKLPI